MGYDAAPCQLNDDFGRGVAQPGSAPQWGCGGRRFESSRPDQFAFNTDFTLTH